jgi:hypothetical protein
MTIYMSIKLFCRSRELRRATEEIEKLERLYTAMALEFKNMIDSVVLEDAEGVKIFYDKLHRLHEQFMSVGVVDKGDEQ